MSYKFVNFFDATLQQAIAAGDTTAYIEPEQEALLPVLSGGNVLRAVLYDQVLDPEIVDITAHSAGTITITRARESTSAQAWPAGTRVTNDITAALADSVLNTTVVARFAGDTTGTDTYTINLGVGATLPVPTEGDEVIILIPNDNTTSVTLTVTDGTTSVGPYPVVHQEGQALEPGDFQADWYTTVRWSSDASSWVLITDASYQLHSTQINDGPLSPANRVPNGNFRYWAAGTSFSTPASGSVTADNTTVEYDGTIGAFTFSRQAFTVGQTDVLGDPRYFARWDQGTAGSGSTYRRVKMKIPGVSYRNGLLAHRSVYLKADASRSVTGKVIQNFGTGGSPSADVTALTGTFNLTTSWQRFELGGTLPSVTGKTLGSNADDALVLELDLPVNTTMTIDIAMEQFEPGHLASYPNANFPWSFQQGGTGGVYADAASLLAGLGGMATTSFPDLVAIEALASTGFPVRTASNTWAQRSLTAPAAGLTISNNDGVSGNPTFALANDLAALEALSGTSTIYYRSGADTWSAVTISANLGFSAGTLGSALGTAAIVADGTSGAAYGKLNANKTDSGNNTWTGTNAFVSGQIFGSGSGNAQVILNGGATSSVYHSYKQNSVNTWYTGVGIMSGSNPSYDIYSTTAGIALSLDLTTRVATFAERPTFNGNTALDTGNGAQLASPNQFAGAYNVFGSAAGNSSSPVYTTTNLVLYYVSSTNWSGIGSDTPGNMYFTVANSGVSELVPLKLAIATGNATFSADVILGSGAPSSNLSAGYRRFAPASITTGTVVAADSGKCVYATGSVTFPNSVFSQGDNIVVLADGSSRTLTQGSGVTMTNGNTGATGSCTLAANGIATIVYTSASACTVYGNV